MEPPISEYDAWSFKKDSNGRWIWIRYSPAGEALTASRADFDEHADCVRDATRRGYRGSVSDYERLLSSALVPEEPGT